LRRENGFEKGRRKKPGGQETPLIGEGGVCGSKGS